MVISGFELIDILQLILMLVRQLNEGRAEVENQYIRAVTRDGHVRAKQAVSRVFEFAAIFELRGLAISPTQRSVWRNELHLRPHAGGGAINITSRPTRLAARRLDLAAGRVDLTHGAGGRAMQQLIEEIFRPGVRQTIFWRRATTRRVFDPAGRAARHDPPTAMSSRRCSFPAATSAGSAVHGTINDLAMAGARPLLGEAGFMLEEGLPLAALERMVREMGEAAREAGVKIVTGDTKVVERGKADGVSSEPRESASVPEGLDRTGGRARRATRSWFPADRATRHRHHGPAARTCNSRRRSCPIPPRCTVWSPTWSRPAGRRCG